LAFVYIMANIGLGRFYYKEHRDEYSVFKHVIIPAIGSIALVVVVYYSVVPLPSWPISLAPFIVLGWLALGVVLLFAVFRGPRAAMFEKAGLAMGEASASAISERYEVPNPMTPPDAER
jgi:hypothetical protein